jgi:hypothetical protein
MNSVTQKNWAVVDINTGSIHREFNTRDEARDARAYNYCYKNLDTNKPNFKRYRLARLTKQVSVEIISK